MLDWLDTVMRVFFYTGLVGFRVFSLAVVHSWEALGVGPVEIDSGLVDQSDLL